MNLSQAPSPVDEAPEQSRTGLAALINPLSFRMSLHDRASGTAELIARHGGRVFHVGDLAQIEAALEQMVENPVHRLVIAGGDGTLQAVVSWFARHTRDNKAMPQLVLLCAGRTNYVAEDIGTQSHLMKTLETILSKGSRQLHPIDRPTLRLAHPSIGEQHGFFMAGAMLDEVIRYVHRWQAEHDNWLRRRHAASTAGVLSIGLRWALRRHRFELPRLRIEADGLGRLDDHCRFLMLSSLNHDSSLVDPYARRGLGPLRITAIRVGAKRLPLHLHQVARGRFSAEMNEDNGYISGRCNNIVINNISSITLDGQEFDLDCDHPLVISPGPVFRFLRP